MMNYNRLTLTKTFNRLVFTNGCFDLFHAGHLAVLRFARQLADLDGLVVVGVNSDDSIKRTKGNGRPVIPQWERLSIITSMREVDEAIIFDEDTPYELIKSLRPDIILKGPDYLGLEKEIVGSDIARVVILPECLRVNTSTTDIISRIRKL